MMYFYIQQKVTHHYHIIFSWQSLESKWRWEKVSLLRLHHVVIVYDLSIHTQTGGVEYQIKACAQTRSGTQRKERGSGRKKKEENPTTMGCFHAQETSESTTDGQCAPHLSTVQHHLMLIMLYCSTKVNPSCTYYIEHDWELLYISSSFHYSTASDTSMDSHGQFLWVKSELISIHSNNFLAHQVEYRHERVKPRLFFGME